MVMLPQIKPTSRCNCLQLMVRKIVAKVLPCAALVKVDTEG